jgi:hypothetical protein
MAFFTYNGKSGDLREILIDLNQHHSDIHLESFFGTNVNFLNIHIKNQHGHLHTSVYHDSNNISQSYVLPYVMNGHTSLMYGQYFRLALKRAICYCSNVYDFDQERLYIELTFLVNDFPLEIIERYLGKFFLEFKIQSLRIDLNQTIYTKVRHRLFQLMDQQQIVQKQNQQFENEHRFFHFYYLYEWGPRRPFNKQFQQLWSRYITKYPMLPKSLGKINLTTKYLHSLNTLLAQEKKPSEIISKTRIKSYL